MQAPGLALRMELALSSHRHVFGGGWLPGVQPPFLFWENSQRSILAAMSANVRLCAWCSFGQTPRGQTVAYICPRAEHPRLRLPSRSSVLRRMNEFGMSEVITLARGGIGRR